MLRRSPAGPNRGLAVDSTRNRVLQMQQQYGPQLSRAVQDAVAQLMSCSSDEANEAFWDTPAGILLALADDCPDCPELWGRT